MLRKRISLYSHNNPIGGSSSPLLPKHSSSNTEEDAGGGKDFLLDVGKGVEEEASGTTTTRIVHF